MYSSAHSWGARGVLEPEGTHPQGGRFHPASTFFQPGASSQVADLPHPLEESADVKFGPAQQHPVGLNN